MQACTQNFDSLIKYLCSIYVHGELVTLAIYPNSMIKWKFLYLCICGTLEYNVTTSQVITGCIYSITKAGMPDLEAEDYGVRQYTVTFNEECLLCAQSIFIVIFQFKLFYITSLRNLSKDFVDLLKK